MHAQFTECYKNVAIVHTRSNEKGAQKTDHQQALPHISEHPDLALNTPAISIDISHNYTYYENVLVYFSAVQCMGVHSNMNVEYSENKNLCLLLSYSKHMCMLCVVCGSAVLILFYVCMCEIFMHFSAYDLNHCIY